MKPRPFRIPFAVLVVPLLWAAATPAISAEPERPNPAVEHGARLYTGCASCHGGQAEGLEAARAPRLAGREDWYLRRQLRKYRDLQRGFVEPKDHELPAEERTRLMHPVVAGLSKPDVDALIAYIRTRQPAPVAAHPTGDPGKGRDLYANCAACHGLAGEGSKQKDAPALRDQHGWYLFNQIRDFRMGWRGTDPRDVHGRLMRDNTDLDDDAIHALAAHLTAMSQPRK